MGLNQQVESPRLHRLECMKKNCFLLAILVLAAGGAFAQEPDKTSSRFYAGLGTGADFPGANWNTDYYLAGGADVFGGYQVDKNWSAQLDVAEWFFTGGGNSL